MEKSEVKLTGGSMSRNAAILILLIGFITLFVNYFWGTAIMVLGAVLLLLLYRLKSRSLPPSSSSS